MRSAIAFLQCPTSRLTAFATPAPEPRPVGALDLTAYRQRLAALATQGIYIGTSSWKHRRQPGSLTVIWPGTPDRSNHFAISSQFEDGYWCRHGICQPPHPARARRVGRGSPARAKCATRIGGRGEMEMVRITLGGKGLGASPHRAGPNAGRAPNDWTDPCEERPIGASGTLHCPGRLRGKKRRRARDYLPKIGRSSPPAQTF